jgi:hypothetical protein
MVTRRRRARKTTVGALEWTRVRVADGYESSCRPANLAGFGPITLFSCDIARPQASSVGEGLANVFARPIG